MPRARASWMAAAAVLLAAGPVLTADRQCQQLPGQPCSCRLNNGSVISLEAISHSDSPVFADVLEVSPASAEGSQYRYYYDPCRSFSLPTAAAAPCHGVSVCQKDLSVHPTPVYYNLGELERAVFRWNGSRGLFYISYVGVYGRQRRVTNVTLVCDWSRAEPNSALYVFPQNPGTPYDYNMTLVSRCACADGCRPRPAGTAAADLSGGTVLLLLVVGAAALYLLLGAAYRRLVVGATGWEVVPNAAFWASLPGLVRDGATTCTTCRRPDADGYDQI